MTDYIAKLQQDARAVKIAKTQLAKTMRSARKAGLSLRDVAAAAGVSYETVRRTAGYPAQGD